MKTRTKSPDTYDFAMAAIDLVRAWRRLAAAEIDGTDGLPLLVARDKADRAERELERQYDKLIKS